MLGQPNFVFGFRVAETPLHTVFGKGWGYDWEFVNAFKRFWIFEKLMSSEIFEKIEINEFIFRDNFASLLNLS